MQLIDKDFLAKSQFNEVTETFLLNGNIIMVAIFETKTHKVKACNSYFAKSFRINFSNKNNIFLENILNQKNNKFEPVISLIGKKPITNILSRYSDNATLESYFYTYTNDSIMMLLQLKHANDMDMIEKMSAVTTEMANLTRELRNKNNQLKTTRDFMVKQARTTATGEIIKILTHQWKQPLTAILSASMNLSVTLQLETFNLEQNEGREKCKDYLNDGLNNITTQIQDLSTTLNELRILYDSNNDYKTIMVCSIIEKALTILRTNLNENNIQFDIQCNAKKISCLENELLESILHILNNSIDAFKEISTATPKIQIIVNDKSTYIEIVIEDNAGGIKEENIDKVMEPYFSTKSLNGNGLGLYIVNVLVTEKMHGFVYLENTDRGLRVVLRIPVDDAITRNQTDN